MWGPSLGSGKQDIERWVLDIVEQKNACNLSAEQVGTWPWSRIQAELDAWDGLGMGAEMGTAIL